MRDAGPQRDVVQPERLDPALQPGLVGALADEREMDCLPAEPGRGVSDARQPMRDPVRPAYSTRQSPGCAPRRARTAGSAPASGSNRSRLTPLRIVWTLPGGTPRLIRFSLNPSLTTTTSSAARYAASSRRSSSRITRRLVSTPSSTKMAGHRSRTSTISRARLSLASSQAAPMEKKVGEETTTASAGPHRRPPSSTLRAMKLRWPMVLRSTPSFGVAYSQVRTTR